MSIASEIQRLKGAKEDIIDAIEDKGVTVPPGTKMDGLATLIADISGGGGEVSISTRRINAEVGMKVVDPNGNVGSTITNYFPHVGNTYYNNFAVVVAGADFSGSGLGKVTFLEEGTAAIGGRTYPTVQIGGVTWMATNLDFKFSGCNVPSSGASTSSDPQAMYYNNDEATYGWDGRKCGLLYNWYAVKHLNDNLSTLCPGWHVPSTAEWDALATAVGGTSTAGTKLKASNVSWASSWGGTDDYGFAALPAGYFYGSFGYAGSNAIFWTATEYYSSYAYYRYFATGAQLISDYNLKYYQYSVRLVQDS